MENRKMPLDNDGPLPKLTTDPLTCWSSWEDYEAIEELIALSHNNH